MNININTVFKVSEINPSYTEDTPTSVLIISVRNKSRYFIPYGEGYECGDGHFIEEISEQEFISNYRFEIKRP